MTNRWTTLLGRGLVVWAVIIIAESAHGLLRQLLLEPFVGDFRARQISVLIGSILILTISLISVRWLKGSRVSDFIVIGIQWVVLTVAFEIVLVRFAMNLSWDKITSDYNLSAGGLMPLGLLVMFMAPLMTAKLYDEV